jgi:CheY-like chemotaxis protein
MDIHHIYLADDDPDDYYLFSTILQDLYSSVQITWFATGHELLQQVHENHHLPDIILLDMNMPGNDGHQCLQKLKNNTATHHIPVIILSTASSPDAIKKAYEYGAAKYLTKPHSIDGYKQIIGEILATANNG